MNVIQDNIVQTKKDRPMIVKPTIIGNAIMRPPSNAINKIVTPSSSRSRPKDGGQSCASHSKSTPSVHRDSHVIVSVCEGRGKATGIVGIAAVDIHRPVLILSQISDSHTYTATLTKLNILRPLEVLVPATFVEGAAISRLVTTIMNQFPNFSVTSVPRSEFNQSRGLHIIQSLCAPVFSSVNLQINQKFYAVAASCALMRYIEQSRRVSYSPKSIKVEYQEPEHTTAIDIDTAYLLELVSNTSKKNVTLFTVVDYCATTPGRKLLRTNILQPPRRKNVIETRLDCVQELIENPNLLTRLQETLKPLSDIEASLTFGTVVPATASSVSERQLNYTLQLKGLLSAVQPLADELKATKHPVFRDIYNRLEGLETRKKILDLISEIVNEDAHLSKGQAGELQRCFAIKSGINDFLDLSRRLYTEGVDSMRAYVDELSETFNLPLRVQHTIKSGFHIILPLTKALRNLKKTDLPPVFIKYNRLSSHIYLNTMDMINFDKRLKNNSSEIQNISNVIIYQLLVDIRPYIGDLYNLCDDVAQLDMLVSLARASSLPNWVRPHLVATHMNLEGARHPVLEHVADRDPVANSVYAYPRNNLHIITGPNMAGKSILLHTISLIQVLSQVGCFVPCTRCTIRVSDRIYARVAQDETALVASSFAVEAAKLAYLLDTLSDSSLVVLDEICRTTSTEEGVALSMAILEKMVKRGAFVFVVTHFVALTKLQDLYPNVSNWHLETLEEIRANNTRISLKFTYKLLSGVTSIDQYGIKLSRIFTSSKSISDRAEALYKYLLPMRKPLESSTSTNPEYLKFKLQAELDLLKIRNQLTDEIQKDKVTNFQNKTGLSFEPSPLTIERTSVLLDQSSSNDNKKTSSSSTLPNKNISGSNSWIPTPSNKSSVSSNNHDFSVPTSNKSSSNQNQDKILNNKHIFSFDVNDVNQQENNEEPKDYFVSDENLTFPDSSLRHEENTRLPHENDLGSTNENISHAQDFCSSIPNKNLLFYNSQNTDSQNRNITFSQFNEFKSQKKFNFSLPQNSNCSSAENSLIDNNSKTLNLIVNSTTSTAIHDSLKSLQRNITFSELKSQKKFNYSLPQNSNWSSAENSLIDNNSKTLNVIVNSTPSSKSLQRDVQKTPKNNSDSPLVPSEMLTTELHNSSPNIPEKCRITEKVSEEISETVPRLVSTLYDSDSESSENDENKTDDSVIINDNEECFSEISSPDELNFATYLNLRKGVTSTPITNNNECHNISSDSDVLDIRESSKYYSLSCNDTESVLPPNTFICNESDLSYKESPVIKRKLGLQHPNANRMLPKKLLKLSLPSPQLSSPDLFGNSLYKTCSSDMSGCSTAVIIGQNKKSNPFVSTPTANVDPFEQDTVRRLNSTEYFSENSN